MLKIGLKIMLRFFTSGANIKTDSWSQFCDKII